MVLGITLYVGSWVELSETLPSGTFYFKEFYQEPKSVLLRGQAEEPLMVLVSIFVSESVLTQYLILKYGGREFHLCMCPHSVVSTQAYRSGDMVSESSPACRSPLIGGYKCTMC